ncbi:MAG TPA: ABC transporter ATP-binding protein [Streptosporangiaceae bacterium]|nr:ABC transporter ATP-binding protein [Streptosporangiaceae bacterium]
MSARLRRFVRLRRSRGRGLRAAGPPALEFPEMAQHRWTAKSAELAETRLRTVARRLPALIAQAVRLAWRASRLDTLATIGLNLVAGVFTAFGLLATTGVLTALFSVGPTPERVRAALPSLLFVGVATAMRAGLQALAGLAQARLKPRVDRIVELRMYELTTSVELAALDDSDFLDEMQRAEGRGMIAAPMMVQHTVDVLTGAVGLAAAAGTLGLLHPLLLPLLLLTAVPEGWASVRAARMGYFTMFSLINVMRRKRVLSGLMADRRHAAEIRSFTMRDFLLKEFERLAAYERDVELDLARRQAIARVFGDILKGIATAGVYVALGLMLWSGAVPLAVAGTAVLAIRTGQSSLANLVYATNRCYEEGLYFGDYLGFTAAAELRIPAVRAAAPAGAVAAGGNAAGGNAAAGTTAGGDTEMTVLPGGFQRIVVEDVTFTYPGADSRSLGGVSLELRRGEVVALVGENGSGKTTLAKILAGLYQPDGGDVRWDDVSLRDVDPDVLRAKIAVIAQEYTRWPMTARQNITMGRLAPGGPAATERAVRRAAEESGADEVIAELTRGYETLLDRRFADGVELSGGQWQRLAVARGFYRNAPLLICDEPTAALDARAEHALFERIRAHADGRTVLLITHRMASVQHADRIYVLDHGRVIEEGDHDRLMAGGGLYAELFNLQASAYHHRRPAAAGEAPSA